LATKKVTMQFMCSEELRDKIREYSENNALSISATVSMLLNQQFKNLDMSAEMVKAIRSLSPEQLQQAFTDGMNEVQKGISNG